MTDDPDMELLRRIALRSAGAIAGVYTVQGLHGIVDAIVEKHCNMYLSTEYLCSDVPPGHFTDWECTSEHAYLEEGASAEAYAIGAVHFALNEYSGAGGFTTLAAAILGAYVLGRKRKKTIKEV